MGVICCDGPRWSPTLLHSQDSQSRSDKMNSRILMLFKLLLNFFALSWICHTFVTCHAVLWSLDIVTFLL